MDKIKCIYAIKDKRNNKVIYIGQTVNFKRRRTEHFCRNIQPIDLYMFEQDRNNFEMNILEEIYENISKEDLQNKEQEYIEHYNTTETGFNRNKSGNCKDMKKWYQDYHKTDKYKQYQLNFFGSEKYKDYKRQYRLKKKLESQDK